MALRIKYNLKAFSELRTTPEAEAYLDEIADAYAEACGDGYEVLPPQKGRRRARRVVATATRAAVLDNSANQTLLSKLPRR